MSEDEFEDVGPAAFDYLKKHVMQCYHKEDEGEISGDARNRSATKTKLNRGVLEEDLKIELLRRLKSTTQADDIETEGVFMLANGIKKVVETSGGINLREFTWWHPRKTMVMMRWLMENLKFHAKQPAMR
ncbi:hypothetical protein H0E87_008578 [Populus deltoides]|uniref:Uncharacterized protein n=1 Tax=Populus deltoides TaxID=3696 RepID=A0A8T2Z107_POPDE|nr:hypothetical protein H0E87_008578 [Populus deltoides]